MAAAVMSKAQRAAGRNGLMETGFMPKAKTK
jgi:hypothetical protein